MNNAEIMRKIFDENDFGHLSADDKELLVHYADDLFAHLEDETKPLHMRNVAQLFSNYRALSFWREFVKAAYSIANPSNRSYEYRIKLFKNCVKKILELMGMEVSHTKEAVKLKEMLITAYDHPEKYVFHKDRLPRNKNEIKNYLEKMKAKRDSIRNFIAAIA